MRVKQRANRRVTGKTCSGRMEIIRWLNTDGVKTRVLIQHYQDPLAVQGILSVFTQEWVNDQKFSGLPAMRIHELCFQNPVSLL